MREQYKSIITADGWILCAKCGHKLARVLQGDESSTSNATVIELKCSSCKALNIYITGEKNGKI